MRITTIAELDALPEEFRYSHDVYGRAALDAATVLLALTDNGHGREVTDDLRWIALEAARVLHAPGRNLVQEAEAERDAARATLERVKGFTHIYVTPEIYLTPNESLVWQWGYSTAVDRLLQIVGGEP